MFRVGGGGSEGAELADLKITVDAVCTEMCHTSWHQGNPRLSHYSFGFAARHSLDFARDRLQIRVNQQEHWQAFVDAVIYLDLIGSGPHRHSALSQPRLAGYKRVFLAQQALFRVLDDRQRYLANNLLSPKKLLSHD
ncbi:MAG: hypothetical protein H7832_03670 [Magnetococcus sp. DMHC-6]